MKQSILTLVFLCVFLFTTDTLKAQSKNAFYVELLGNGLIFSANYDFRFSDKNGWGGRIGLGYVGTIDGDDNGGGILTVPIMVNNLLGKDGKYFEVGAGITFISGDAEFANDNVSKVIGTLSFMYRRQPVDGGFMWKIGITPIIADGTFVPWWPGIGIGYSW